MTNTRERLGRKVEDLEAVRAVMAVLKEVCCAIPLKDS